MKGETIKAGPYTLSYTYHRGKKPLTIVPIHGLGGSKDYWQPMHDYPELAAYSILVPDLVGYGDSQPAPKGFKYTMREQAAAVKALIDAVGVKGDILLIPHSMGGPIGVYLAQLLGTRVKGIVYAEGNIDFDDCFGSNLVITKYTYDEYLKTGFQRDLDGMEKRGYPPSIVASQAKAGAVTIYRSSEDLVKVSKEDKLAGELKALKVPTLVVYGEKNKGLWTSEKKMAALFPLVYTPGAAHMMMADNPSAFYGEVTKFIKALK
ncbi:MAG: alpha/beta hydrolase [Candidatus Bathyarchaeota archaeon]|nr:alpha/beta hydrolase [Candidatus Bathyarchaeota archaeon]